MAVTERSVPVVPACQAFRINHSYYRNKVNIAAENIFIATCRYGRRIASATGAIDLAVCTCAT